MFKKPFFKVLGSTALAVMLSLGLISAAFAAGNTQPTTSAQTAACATPKWTGINPQTNEQGLLITDIAKDSPAAKAGLTVNRILLSVNGKNIAQQADLDALVAGAKAGDKLTLEVAPQGGPISKLVVTLGTNAGKPYLGIQTMQVPVVMGPFTYTETTPASCTSKPFELPGSVARGLYVTSVDQNSAAAKAGLAAGDVILDVNGKSAGTPDNLNKMISALKPGTDMELRLYNTLTKTTSNLKIGLGDKPALNAQVSVIVESAFTSPASSSRVHTPFWRDSVLTVQQFLKWMHHMHIII